ncbi:replication endonuclease [Pelomonas sp. V22]|uniref:replication endonuclease n=1 Tax=Pelomonas sp. V22 TaxID=2822139 RepID=UPI0024A82D5C|nr:replication endonuclease [Pelomonas sp. V22]MDI4632632.1 replication endonuclease [Pelomonas sp. V22]
MVRLPTDAEWVEGRIRGLPPRWRHKLRRRWEQRSVDDYVGANVELREATAALLSVRVSLDASDSEICDAAERQALRCLDRLALTVTVKQARASMERVCIGQGITPPSEETEHGPALARMCCPLWWRRKLRKHHGQTVEGAAVRLGYVNRFRDLYVSNERLAERTQQNKRNASMLEATTARNDAGQVFTLAELAAKSTASKAIRRAELMTRIAGFERYADAEGYQGVFITLTCPSRFHRYMIVNDGKAAVPNPKYDWHETPATAHKHLTRVWARSRAALARQELRPFGFRISEPQHDGTPHWHMLLFCPPAEVEQLMATLQRYALQDSGDEKGALQHRCDFKLIDKARGTAAGYIAKYVAKNIDGEHVGDDLEGRPATESAKRVEAWCSTWRIRQFQQIGGPPVSVWRELRRIKHLPADAPVHLHHAHRAANKQVQRDGDETATVAWDAYCRAQGGIACGRNAAIKLTMREAEGLGRYGDAAPPRPVGVETWSHQTGDAEGNGEQAQRWQVESERSVWTIERVPARRFDWRSFDAESATPAQPRTSVNNCTQPNVDGTKSPTPAASQHSYVRSGALCYPPGSSPALDAGRILAPWGKLT